MKKILFTLTLLLSGQVFAQEPVDLVYPHLDAANSRWFFFSSACRPFGMVNLSPDTELGGAWGSGYRYHTEEIKGFSHIHAWQLAGVSVMPLSGEVIREAGYQKLAGDYYSPFSHEKEIVKPGYHKVFLERYGTEVELSSTTRVGFHKIRFPEVKGNTLLIKLSGKLGPSELIYGELKRINAREVQGMVVNDSTIRRPKKTSVYFHIQLNTDIVDILSFEEQSVTEISGNSDGSFLVLGDSHDPVLMKVGISYVSCQQAKSNINAELEHWDFERIKKESFDEWNEWLGRIRVEGGSKEEIRRFYTDLWHGLQGRRIISDANGKYADMTGSALKIKQITLDANGRPSHHHFNSDSFWGAQWTLNTLWHLVYPKVSSDFCNSLLAYYRDGGLIPRGPSGGNYTYVMTGASSTPFLVSAYQKGIRDFDVEMAYEGMKLNHMPGGIMDFSGYEHRKTESGGVEPYMEKGYVPYPYKPQAKAFHKAGAGQTLEYAYQDWTLAQLARELGKEDDYSYFLDRSSNYKNLYDTVSAYIRPRDLEGQWMDPYSPETYARGYVESNGYQATWFVPHDYHGLAELMGGRKKAINKLNWQFEEAAKQGFTSGKKHADETGDEYRRIPINYGNQPSIQTAFIFHELGAPWLTQKWSRAVVDSVYSGLSPDYGYNGDEDQGLMGSLAVLMKMGLFQINGGTEKDPIYLLGSPIFSKITIQLSAAYYPGKPFTIETVNNSDSNVYVQSVSLNGEIMDRLYLRHSEIIAGGQLILDMGPEPNKKLGAR